MQTLKGKMKINQIWNNCVGREGGVRVPVGCPDLETLAVSTVCVCHILALQSSVADIFGLQNAQQPQHCSAWCTPTSATHTHNCCESFGIQATALS